MNLQSFCFTTFSPSLSGFRRQSVKRCVMGCVVCTSFSTISSKQDSYSDEAKVFHTEGSCVFGQKRF